jgi:hypothetical protein
MRDVIITAIIIIIIIIINLSTVPTMRKAIYMLTLGCHGGDHHHLILMVHIYVSFVETFVLDFVHISA